MKMSRRAMLKVGLSSLAYYSTLATTPRWISRSASALIVPRGASDRILVIIQQAGGNDGLNTVIPYTDENYRIVRPALQVPLGQQIVLDSLNGLHPRLSRLADRYLDKGQVAIVQSVGYMNPNYSHFSSMDYLEFGTVPGGRVQTAGWVERFYDNACSGRPDTDGNPLSLAAAGIGSTPASFRGFPGGYTPPAIEYPADYALMAETDPEARFEAIRTVNRPGASDADLDFVRRTENVAEASIKDVEKANAEPTLVPEADYPDNSLGRGLKMISKIIRAGFKTQIFYASHGGYDTHGGQVNLAKPLEAGMHPKLLGEFDSAVGAFLKEMELSGNLDRVLVMTFSEFGRRVHENGGGNTRGTDHGAANCLFLMGGGVQSGIYGGQPDLAVLDKGNLRYQTDFRSVFSRVVEGWFGTSSAPVFGDDVFNDVVRYELPQLAFLKGDLSPKRAAPPPRPVKATPVPKSSPDEPGTMEDMKMAV